MRGDVIDRCPTGIQGFDEISQGGFVRDSDNVLVGGPGSGKTTFLLQFLWNGVTKFNENGLYCSFEPDIVETIKDAMSYGWDFSKLDQLNRIKFMKFSPQTEIQELKSELTKLISKFNIKRICFDPVSVLALNQSADGKTREILFELASLMKRLKVTTILADETLQNTYSGSDSLTRTDIIKFLADSVTMLYEGGIQGTSDRALRIEKMRRTAHIRTPVGMKVTSSGIQVIPNPQNTQ